MAAAVHANGASDGLTDLGLMDRGVVEAHADAVAAQLDSIQHDDHIGVVGAHGHTLPIDQSPVQKEPEEALSPISEPVEVDDLRYSSGMAAAKSEQDAPSDEEDSSTVEDTVVAVGETLSGGGGGPPAVEEQNSTSMENGAPPASADEQMSGEPEPEPEPDRKRPPEQEANAKKQPKLKRARTEVVAPKKKKKKKKAATHPKKRKASEPEEEPGKKKARPGKKKKKKKKASSKVASASKPEKKKKTSAEPKKAVATSAAPKKKVVPKKSGTVPKKAARPGNTTPKKATAQPKRAKPVAKKNRAAPSRNKFVDVEADVGAAEAEGPAEKVAKGPVAYTKPGVNPDKDLPMGGRGDSSSEDDSIVNDEISYLTDSDEDVPLKKGSKKNRHDGSASFYRRMDDDGDDLMLGLDDGDAAGTASAAAALGKRPTNRRRLTQSTAARKRKHGGEGEEEWTSDSIPQIVADPENEWPAYKEMSTRIVDKLRTISRCNETTTLAPEKEVAALTKSLFIIARHMLTPEAASANAEQMIEIISKIPDEVTQCSNVLWKPIFGKLRDSFGESHRDFLRDILRCTMSNTFDIALVNIGDDEKKALKCMWTDDAIEAGEAVWRVGLANSNKKNVVFFYVKRSPSVPNLYVQALCALRSIYMWPAVFTRHISLWQERKHVSESMSADMRMLEFIKADASVEVVAEALATHFASKHVVFTHIL
jgi:hypothetical protein